MYIPPSLTAEMARARQADLRADARHRRLVRDARALHRPSWSRRAMARCLLVLARRVDPSLRVSASLPAAHAG